MEESIYPFHIQAEKMLCFLLLTCVYPEYLSACNPVLLQVRGLPISGHHQMQ